MVGDTLQQMFTLLVCMYRILLQVTGNPKGTHPSILSEMYVTYLFIYFNIFI